MVLILALIGDVFIGVFSRYVLQATVLWYDEVARLCFVWIVFLGAAVGVRRGMHFRMRLVVERLGPAAQGAADRFATLTVLTLGVLLVVGGVGILPVARGQVTDALGVSMIWFYAALPAGGACMVAFSLPLLRSRAEPR
jgi:TRAP-type C4-dicarboxylate transport system permease small subunit